MGPTNVLEMVEKSNSAVIVLEQCMNSNSLSPTMHAKKNNARLKMADARCVSKPTLNTLTLLLNIYCESSKWGGSPNPFGNDAQNGEIGKAARACDILWKQQRKVI